MFGGERLTARRLWVLVHGLPPDAVTWREDKSRWSPEDEWAASIVETLDLWGTEITGCLIALGGGKPKLPRPERIKHPERPEPESSTPSNALSVEQFEQMYRQSPPEA